MGRKQVKRLLAELERRVQPALPGMPTAAIFASPSQSVSHALDTIALEPPPPASFAPPARSKPREKDAFLGSAARHISSHAGSTGAGLATDSSERSLYEYAEIAPGEIGSAYGAVDTPLRPHSITRDKMRAKRAQSAAPEREKGPASAAALLRPASSGSVGLGLIPEA